jgi:hypothetical protein
MNKIKYAISNNVYEYDNHYKKVLRSDGFTDLFRIDEVNLINNLDLGYKATYDNGDIIMTKVAGVPYMIYSDEEIISIACVLKNIQKIKYEFLGITNFKKTTLFLLENVNFEFDYLNFNEAMAILKKDPVICNNDLVVGNIIIKDKDVNIID